MADDPAFSAFVRQHGRSLFGTAYLLTGSGDAAEDLVQETLTSLLPKWGRVVAAESPAAYARRALVNRFLSSIRRPDARTVSVWQLPEIADPTDLAEQVVDRELIWQLLGRLPARQRAAIVLRYFHDHDDTTIATTLGCRVATVRSLISRGVAAMRETSLRRQSPPICLPGGEV
jgi:RNA polymerase sigma-70 factor (sigma-E family)